MWPARPPLASVGNVSPVEGIVLIFFLINEPLTNAIAYHEYVPCHALRVDRQKYLKRLERLKSKNLLLFLILPCQLPGTN